MRHLCPNDLTLGIANPTCFRSIGLPLNLQYPDIHKTWAEQPIAQRWICILIVSRTQELIKLGSSFSNDTDAILKVGNHAATYNIFTTCTVLPIHCVKWARECLRICASGHATEGKQHNSRYYRNRQHSSLLACNVGHRGRSGIRFGCLQAE
jgi:hypothetical protein